MLKLYLLKNSKRIFQSIPEKINEFIYFSIQEYFQKVRVTADPIHLL